MESHSIYDASMAVSLTRLGLHYFAFSDAAMTQAEEASSVEPVVGAGADKLQSLNSSFGTDMPVGRRAERRLHICYSDILLPK